MLVGLTKSSVVTSLIPLLFTMIGGSVIVFLQKIDAANRELAGRMVFYFAASTLLGTLLGISISEYHLLSPRQAYVDSSSSNATTESTVAPCQAASAPASPYKYLNSASSSAINAIDVKHSNGVLTDKQAYDQLYTLAESCAKLKEDTTNGKN